MNSEMIDTEVEAFAITWLFLLFLPVTVALIIDDIFPVYCIIAGPLASQMWCSESGLSTVSPGRAKHSSERLEGRKGRQGSGCNMIGIGKTRNVVKECFWDESEFDLSCSSAMHRGLFTVC
jgi:hypothetical protein